MKYTPLKKGIIDAFVLKEDTVMSSNRGAHKGQEGDYLVIHENNYIEIVDKATFESNYQLNFETFTSVPSIWTETISASCDHDFPLVWGGVIPPRCLKCGKEAASHGIITSMVDYSNKS